MSARLLSLAVMVMMLVNTNDTKERHHRNLQRTHWYTLTGPTDAWPGPRGLETDHGAEYVDYHLAPDPVPAPHVTRESRDRGHVSRSASRVTGTRVTSDITGNVTAHLWQSVYLRCTVTGFIQGVHTVSWTKTAQSDNPIALTFNDKVFVSDSRINVYIDVDTWVLVLYKVVPADEATYECHVNADPPQKVAIHLFVKVPVMKVMDGFGRNLADQYYKAGSSLEIVCELDSVPYFWNSTDISGLLVWQHKSKVVAARPKDGISIQTEQVGPTVFSRLAITQASSVHEGNYSCSVPDYINTPVRIHIIQDENQAFVASGNTHISASGGEVGTYLFKLSFLFLSFTFTWLLL